MLRQLCFFIIALLLPLGNVQPLFAQIIIEPPLVWPASPMVTLERHEIEAVIEGQAGGAAVAAVQVTQVLRNLGGSAVEGSFVFPLPGEATVSNFQLSIDGRVIEGKLLPKQEARAIYESIVRSQRDPALLEYLGYGLFQTSVFPIPPQGQRTLQFRYTAVLTQEEGLFHFHHPLQAQRYQQLQPGLLSLRIELRNQSGLRTLYSPSHNVNVERRGDSGAVVRYEQERPQNEPDFDLYFANDSQKIGVSLLSYQPAGEDGYFVLLAAPGLKFARGEIAARDVVLTLDVSGSMQGEKIAQARQAAHYLVDHLNAGDRFNLLSFSSGVDRWQEALQPVGKTSRTQAHAWIDRLQAQGSTDINRALLESLALFDDTGKRPAYLLFMTDGLPTVGETDAGQILGNAQRNRPRQTTVRIFNFGVGYDVNTDLLNLLSQNFGGRSSYVHPGEAIDEAVGAVALQLSKPVLVDVQLEIESSAQVSQTQPVGANELYPYPLPDFFAGEQQVIVGRYRHAGEVDITLSGQVNGALTVFQYPGRSLRSQGGEDFVARLWATRKIGALLNQIRQLGAQQELIDQIVELSLRYGIVTPYTSYLVQEPGMVLPGQGPAIEEPQQPSEEPPTLRASAQAAVSDEAEKMATGEASGAEAVAASEVRSQLQTAVIVEQSDEVRFACGRAFVKRSVATTPNGQVDELWVDTAFEQCLTLEQVVFASERYFELGQQPELAACLAIAPHVIVVLGDGQALQVIE
jgi:Ca-activated chloride channel family protein